MTSSFPQKSRLVLGLGLSGISTITMLKYCGEIYCYDDNLKVFEDTLKKFHNVKRYQGDQSLSSISEIIVSPGIKPTHPILLAARANHIKIKTEFDLALESHVPKTLFLVTGTNGKSSVCNMISHILDSQKIPHFLGGNIGNPCIEWAQTRPAVAVIELSSYHLHYAHDIPSCFAIWTNFAFDHVDWHGSIEHYYHAKKRLIDSCLKTTSPFWVGESVIKYADIKIKDKYNHHILNALPEVESLQLDWPSYQIENACFALYALESALKIPVKNLVSSLKNYEHLPYRFATTFQNKNYRIINDSKSTNLHSTVAALSSLPSKEPFILLLGGAGKGESFADILNVISSYHLNIVKIICYGRDGAAIYASINNKQLCEHKINFIDAMNALFEYQKKTPVSVLFSPGCASFDEFKNYQDRGRRFDLAYKDFLSN